MLLNLLAWACSWSLASLFKGAKFLHQNRVWSRAHAKNSNIREVKGIEFICLYVYVIKKLAKKWDSRITAILPWPSSTGSGHGSAHFRSRPRFQLATAALPQCSSITHEGREREWAHGGVRFTFHLLCIFHGKVFGKKKTKKTREVCKGLESCP